MLEGDSHLLEEEPLQKNNEEIHSKKRFVVIIQNPLFNT